MTALLTLPDHPAFDLFRGIAAGIGITLALASVVVLLLIWYRRAHAAVPDHVWLAPLGWLLLDVYVAAREIQQLGHPVFILGLPLALAGEIVALVYLRRLWRSTGGLRRRPQW